jgi:polyisoprenoid-binding protein YceI
MKKLLLSVCCLTIGATAVTAQKCMTRTGKISFDASAPKSLEKIEAVNNEVATVVDEQKGDIVFQVLVKSFKFERALMQEHFNENYMESDKFPKADFKGSITNISEINFTKDGTYNVKVSGKLTVHGVTNEVTEPGTIVVEGNNATLKTKFTIKLKDYNIDVPSVVGDKIGKEAAISLECMLTRK